MWYLVILALVVGFVIGIMFSQHYKKKAKLIDESIIDITNKVIEKIKEK